MAHASDQGHRMRRIILLIACLLLALPLARAQSDAADPGLLARWWRGKYLLGTWGGGRDLLEQRGVRLDLRYMHDIAGNPSGGRRQGLTYADNVHFGLELDLERLVRWPGAQLTVSGLNRAGQSLSNEFIGNQYNAQQVFGGQTYMLYALNLEQRAFQGRLSLKAGRFAAAEDFNGAAIYGLYMNHGINGFVRNVQLDTQYSVYPFATWAARVRLQLSDALDLRLGAFHTSPRVFDPTRHGADLRILRGDGVLFAGQLSLTLHGLAPAAPDASAAVRARATGQYWLGGTTSRYRYARFDGGAPERFSYGVYAHAEQLVFRESPQGSEGLTLWAAGGYYPQKAIAIIPAQLNGGASYEGPLPGRPADALYVGAVYGAFGRDYARAAEARGAPRAPSHELVLELAYRAVITPFLFVQPDVQYIVRPAGLGTIPNALVLGVQSGVVL